MDLNWCYEIYETGPSCNTELKLFALSTVVTAILVFALYLHLTHLAFIALGPGGTPPTITGFIKIYLLSFLAVSDPYSRHTDGVHASQRHGYLGNIPARLRERPVTRGIAPHRQVTQKASRELVEKLSSAIAEMSSSHETIVLGTSCIEKHGLALFHNERTRINEICHVHSSDGSLHVVLGKADSEIVLQKGWGERHPLSHGGWFERFVPAGFVMVYAPRDEGEIQTILRIVSAAR